MKLYNLSLFVEDHPLTKNHLLDLLQRLKGTRIGFTYKNADAPKLMRIVDNSEGSEPTDCSISTIIHELSTGILTVWVEELNLLETTGVPLVWLPVDTTVTLRYPKTGISRTALMDEDELFLLLNDPDRKEVYVPNAEHYVYQKEIGAS